MGKRLYRPEQYVVGANREMVMGAIRSVAAEARFREGRYSLEEALDTEYGPCAVVRMNAATRSGPIGKIVLQEAPKGIIVKTLPHVSDHDPDGKLFQRFRLALVREFGKRRIKPQD